MPFEGRKIATGNQSENACLAAASPDQRIGATHHRRTRHHNELGNS